MCLTRHALDWVLSQNDSVGNGSEGALETGSFANRGEGEAWAGCVDRMRGPDAWTGCVDRMRGPSQRSSNALSEKDFASKIDPTDSHLLSRSDSVRN